MQLILNGTNPSTKLKPFIKWVGGKRQLLDQLRPYFPINFKNYYEPFIGGGAVLFGLQPKIAFINDINPELINTYQVIKNNPQELITTLSFFDYSKTFYEGIRLWDRDVDFLDKYSEVERAARFIYINKCGFNGLWRVNKKGQCNVPFGRHINPDYIQETTINECSKYLQNVFIMEGDFMNALKTAEKDDFVYCDPPYYPVSETANFTEYTQERFNTENQIRLKKLMDSLTQQGVKIMVSNSFTPFAIELFKDYNQYVLSARRSINSVSNKRGATSELLVTNYVRKY